MVTLSRNQLFVQWRQRKMNEQSLFFDYVLFGNESTLHKIDMLVCVISTDDPNAVITHFKQDVLE